MEVFSPPLLGKSKSTQEKRIKRRHQGILYITAHGLRGASGPQQQGKRYGDGWGLHCEVHVCQSDNGIT